MTVQIIDNHDASLCLCLWERGNLPAKPLFVLTGSSQGSQLFTQIAGMQMSSSEFVSPDTLLDLGLRSPRLDTSLRLGAPVGWEMSLGDEP